MKVKGKEVDDYTVYATYLGNIGIGTMYESPFREDDTLPSFGIYDTTYENGGTGVLWKDYGLDQKHFDPIEFVKELHDNIRTRQQARDKIYRDVVLNKSRVKVRPPKRKNKTGKVGVLYRRHWSKVERNYWGKISNETLKKYRTYPVVSSWWYDKLAWCSDDSVPTYVYLVGKGFQLYRPGQKFKFLMHNTSDQIFGWEQLPESGKDLIITSSGKDVISAVESTGIPAIAPFGEKNFKNILLKINEIDRRFENVYICLDGDKVGIKAAKDLESLTDWRNLAIEYPKGLKDLADVLWKYDAGTLKKLIIKNILNGSGVG